MAADTKSKRVPAPPYISFKTLINLLDRLQQTHLPPQIDRSYLDSMSGGYQSQVIAALRWLDLVGEQGDVLGSLKSLAENPEQRPGIMGELLRSHYPSVFALSARNGTQGQLEEEFRQFGITGGTLRSAIAFFLHAARYAEVSVSPHFKIPAVRTGEAKPNARRSRSTKAKESEPASPLLSPALEPSADMRTRYLDMLLKKAESQEAMDTDLLNRIETLLGYGTEPQE